MTLSPAGTGYLLVTLTLRAGESSILVEEDTDVDEVWAVNLYEELAPDQVRYQGHQSNDPKLGHMPDGSIYPLARRHFRGEPDAIVDLQHRTPQTPRNGSSAESWGYMAVWDPWIANGGWYWQLYNSTAPQNGNVVSIFAGPVSRVLSAGMSGASIFRFLPIRVREASRSRAFYRKAIAGDRMPASTPARVFPGESSWASRAAPRAGARADGPTLDESVRRTRQPDETRGDDARLSRPAAGLRWALHGQGRAQ